MKQRDQTAVLPPLTASFAPWIRAAALDRAHHQLVEADVAGIGTSPRRPVVAEDIYRLWRQSFSLSIVFE